MKKTINEYIQKFNRKLKLILCSDLSARQIAVNFTLGIIVGLLVPMGLQTVAIVIICSLLKFNFLIVVFAAFISNPFTVVIIYYTAFKIGDSIINSGIAWNSVSGIFNSPDIESILTLSLDGLTVIYLGLLIESLVLGLLTYFIVYRLANIVKINGIYKDR